jgi:hypothetical protein
LSSVEGSVHDESDTTTTEKEDHGLNSTEVLRTATAEKNTQIEFCRDLSPLAGNLDAYDEPAGHRHNLEMSFTASATALAKTPLCLVNDAGDSELEAGDSELDVAALKSGLGVIELRSQAESDEDKYILALSTAIKNAMNMDNDYIATLGEAEQEVSYFEDNEPGYGKNAFGANNQLKKTPLAEKTDSAKGEHAAQSGLAVSINGVHEGEMMGAVVEYKSHQNDSDSHHCCSTSTCIDEMCCTHLLQSNNTTSHNVDVPCSESICCNEISDISIKNNTFQDTNELSMNAIQQNADSNEALGHVPVLQTISSEQTCYSMQGNSSVAADEVDKIIDVQNLKCAPDERNYRNLSESFETSDACENNEIGDSQEGSDKKMILSIVDKSAQCLLDSNIVESARCSDHECSDFNSYFPNQYESALHLDSLDTTEKTGPKSEISIKNAVDIELQCSDSDQQQETLIAPRPSQCRSTVKKDQSDCLNCICELTLSSIRDAKNEMFSHHECASCSEQPFEIDCKVPSQQIQVQLDSNRVDSSLVGESDDNMCIEYANQFKPIHQVVHVTNRNDLIDETMSIASHSQLYGNFCEHPFKTVGYESATDELSLPGSIQVTMYDRQNSERRKSKLNASGPLNMQLSHDLSTQISKIPASPALQVYLPQITSALRTLQTPSPNSSSMKPIEVGACNSSQPVNPCHQKGRCYECDKEELEKCSETGTHYSNKLLVSLPQLAVHKAEAKRDKSTIKSADQRNVPSKTSFSYLPVTGPMREIRALQSKIRIQAEHKAAIKLQDACERRRIARMEQHSTALRDESKKRDLEVLNAALLSAFDKAKEMDRQDSAVGSSPSIPQSLQGEFEESCAANLFNSKTSNQFTNDTASDNLLQKQIGATSKAYLNLPPKTGSRSLAFTCGFQSLSLATQK